LFIVWPLPRFRFASDRLANILRQENISGVKLIPAAEIRVESGGMLSPGQITTHMPLERAHELNGRFGID
jgi:hypothetical protein